MKVEIEKEEKGFEPFKLTLTVESVGELKALYHLFNLGATDIKKLANESMRLVDGDVEGYTGMDAWCLIKEKCIELGIRK